MILFNDVIHILAGPALEGYVAGLVVAMPFALRGSGEPSITMQPIDYVGWFVVLGMMGMLNSLTLYIINAAVARRLDSDESSIS
jgi:hypothetical protein